MANWNLSRVLPDPENIDARLQQLDIQVKQIEQWKEKIAPDISVAEFKKVLCLLESVQKDLMRLCLYVYFKFSEDTSNKKILALRKKIEEKGTEFGNRTLFFSQSWKRFDDQNAQRIINALPEYGYYLQHMHALHPFMLDDDIEKVINIKDLSGSNALVTIYDVLTNGFKFNWNGKEISQEDLLQNVKDPHPEVRKRAYEELYRVYKKYESVIGEIYIAIVNDWRQENIGLRKYASPIGVRNKSNDVNDAAVNALISATKKHDGLFQEYFKIKFKRLKLVEFSRFHLYAPLAASQEKVLYDEAKKVILDAFNDFSPEFRNIAEKILTECVDYELRENKMSGGYCWGAIPEVLPYIMINYTGESRSVSTLAHELGHGIHFMLAAKKHNVFHAHSALPLAETASIFCELLLIEKLKKENPELADELIMQQLDNTYASITRQIGFVDFENTAHEIIARHGSVDELKQEYLKKLKAQLQGIDIPDDFQYEWLYVHHIFDRPFYCYAYAFGNLLALSLYGLYKQQGKSFVPKIITLLTAGGSRAPADIVADIGFDISDEKFWASGFKVIRGLVDAVKK